MPFAIRPWLIWLLLLALPVQGVAAATMLWCHTAAAGRQVTPAAVAPDLAETAHDCVHGHPAEVEAANDDAAAPADAGHHGGSGVCSACAACCAAFAVPASVPLLSGVEPGNDPLHGPPAGAAHYTTDGPERPPRPLPA